MLAVKSLFSILVVTSKEILAVAVLYINLTKLLCQLLPVLAVTGSLLVVETRILGLDGCQTQLYSLIKKFTK